MRLGDDQASFRSRVTRFSHQGVELVLGQGEMSEDRTLMVPPHETTNVRPIFFFRQSRYDISLSGTPRSNAFFMAGWSG